MGEVKRGEKSQEAAVLRVETIVMASNGFNYLFCKDTKLNIDILNYN